MVADWNWFLSAVAQSAAAIVAILAGFVITKIITNQSEYYRNLDRMRDALLKAEELKEQVKLRRIDKVNSWSLVVATARLERALATAGAAGPENDYYSAAYGWSIFLDPDEIHKRISETMAAFEAKGRDDNWARTPHEREADLVRQLHDLERLREGVLIRDVLFHVAQHIKRVVSLRDHAARNPECSRMIGWICIGLAVAFSTAVLYPLTALPAAQAPPLVPNCGGLVKSVLSLKGLALVSLSALFLLALAAFFVRNTRLRYPSDIRFLLRDYAELGGYSSYFKALVANRRAWGVSQEITNGNG